jgi:hypothetical protein
LGAAAAARERALHHLGETRAAVQLAESALISLQSGEAAPAGRISIHELPTESNIAGMVWVQVQTTVNGRQATLVGLIPAGHS